MNKILFIITKSTVGGAQKFVSEQIEICAQSNNFTCYLATSEKGWIEEKSGQLIEDTFYSKKILSRTSLSVIINLRKFIKQNDIGLVVCNSANGGLYGRLAGALAGINSIYVSHGWSSVYNGGLLSVVLNKVEYILSKVGTKVLCVSQGDYNIGKNVIKVPFAKLEHINNAILPVPISKKKKAGFRKTVFTLARFVPPKRYDIIVQALKLIPDIDAHLFGEGELKKGVEAFSKKQNIKNVFFKGEVKQFSDFLLYDVFLLISDSEGLPMSAIEAMSAGRPLVLSNVGGCPSLINENGVCVNNTPESIAAGIKECFIHYDKYSANSLEMFHRKFNLKQRKGEFLNLYERTIKTE